MINIALFRKPYFDATAANAANFANRFGSRELECDHDVIAIWQSRQVKTSSVLLACFVPKSHSIGFATPNGFSQRGDNPLERAEMVWSRGDNKVVQFVIMQREQFSLLASGG